MKREKVYLQKEKNRGRVREKQSCLWRNGLHEKGMIY